MLYDDVVILVFAKAPVEGNVNTRLIPDIGAQAATQLQNDLIHQRLLTLSQADLCAVQLWCAPDTSHDCFVGCQQQYPVVLKQQSGKDLGMRMHNAAETVLKNYDYCIIIGTDAPALSSTDIKEAIEKLKSGSTVVFVPAEDGGYVLIGLQQSQDFLFHDIKWGSAKVMQQSRVLLDQHKVSYAELSTCWDIDRIEDYQRYMSSKFSRP